MGAKKLTLIPLLCGGFLVGILLLLSAWPRTAVQSIARAEGSSAQAGWWDNGWDYRVLLTANGAGFARQDKPAEVGLNFTALLASLGQSGALDRNSIRVIEADSGGNVLDTAVAFQFDAAEAFDASSNAEGILTWLMVGNTAANETRRFLVYFDVTGKGFTPPSITPLVTATDGVVHKGYESIHLVAQNAEYFYHKAGGGFATLLDSGNKDWISWNSSETPSGAAGNFRGIPNMVHPGDGGYFHPGRTTASTTLVSQGPLKATFKSTNIVNPNNGQWEIVWDVFPSYARMTVTKAPAALNYWFLYEGTPGGALDVDRDFLTRSDETSIPASGTWTTDIPGEEWIFVGDGKAKRSLFLAHHEDDTKIDGYYAMDGLMTVFGFGRNNSSRYLMGSGRQFTIGLVGSKVTNAVRPAVYNAYKALEVTVGNAEAIPVAPPTATVTPLPQHLSFGPVVFGEVKGPTERPTLTPTATSTPTHTATPTNTPTPSSTPTASATPTNTPEVTPTRRVTPTNTPDPNSTELLVFDWNEPVTEQERGFPYDQPPIANGDWTSPVNFAQGTLQFRVEIRSQPVVQDMKLQFCFWQEKDGDNFGLETCGPTKAITGVPGAVATWSAEIEKMWKKDNNPLEWNRARYRNGAAIKNSSDLPVSNYNGWNWNGEDPKEWYPLDMRYTVVVVAKGATFSGWDNYPPAP